MNVISRRDVFRFSSLALAAPVVAAISRDAMSQTLAPSAQTDNNSNNPPYSKDLEAYVTDGLARVYVKVRHHVAQQTDWLQAASLASLYARHTDASKVNDAFMKSISVVDPAQLSIPVSYAVDDAFVEFMKDYDSTITASDFSLGELTLEKLKSHITKLKTRGMSGVLRDFSQAARTYGLSLGPDGIQTEASWRRGLSHPHYIEPAVLYPRTSKSSFPSRSRSMQAVGQPKLLRVVAPNCHVPKGYKICDPNNALQDLPIKGYLLIATAGGSLRCAFSTGGLLAEVCMGYGIGTSIYSLMEGISQVEVKIACKISGGS